MKIIILPLGTISPYCKDNMNCPGYLVTYGNSKILLDCGNGITRLLKFPEDLKNLNVFITHFHNDHFGDLGILQYASYVYHNLGMLNEKINIYLPKEDINNIKSSIINNKETFSTIEDIDENKIMNIGIMKVSFHNNHSHTIPSYVIKIENDKFKMVYTSDVGITNLNELVNFCSNADLLICESSFIKEHNSNLKTHLKASEAAEIAKRANVKQLLLTHFLPETEKIKYLKEAKEIFENVMVAKEGKKLVYKE